MTTPARPEAGGGRRGEPAADRASSTRTRTSPSQSVRLEAQFRYEQLHRRNYERAQDAARREAGRPRPGDAADRTGARRSSTSGAGRSTSPRRRWPPRAGCKKAVLTMLVFGVLGRAAVARFGRAGGDARPHDPRAQRHHGEVRPRRARRRPERIALRRDDGQAQGCSVPQEAPRLAPLDELGGFADGGLAILDVEGNRVHITPSQGRRLAALLPRPGAAPRHRRAARRGSP